MKILLIGKRGCGKSTLLHAFFANIPARGVVCPPVFRDYCYIGKDVFNLATNECHVFCRLKEFASFSGLETRQYIINYEAIEFAKSAIDHACLEQISPIIIDEVGPLEMKGEGIYDALKKALDNQQLKLIVVRTQLEKQFLALFPGDYSKLYMK